MLTKQTNHKLQIPPDLDSKEFAQNKYEYYKWLREESPVFHGKYIIPNSYILSRYKDCAMMLNDPRFIRDRSTITGGSKSIIPLPLPSFISLPKSVELMAQNMLYEDEPDHKRLRSLVHQAFTRKSLAKINTRIEQLTNELLDKGMRLGTVDLKEAYALPIPVTVIQEMVGVADEDMSELYKGIETIMDGFSGWRIVRTMFWDMSRLFKFIRKLIERKRNYPGEDILTGLIQAEEEGESLSEDEIVSMVFLLIAAGFETTVELITNGVIALLQHPEQLARLRQNPDLIEPAIEEILRFCGSVQSTEANYAAEDITLHGVTIPKGATVFPFLGAANRDPAMFKNPEVFDITRSPNKHLAFGSGIHSCLGAQLARIETKIAINNLLKRNPNLRLAVEQSELEIQVRPGFHMYKSLPVVLG
ncbi:cytochrome P450 like protein [Calothrix parasitica NIES-267]|uniref:Cytochrome P450 like protein n=1 Tax=Calothrix parasitica NIES-267 TaxID=1973488 RepID=A0A1Z4LVG6_9CYAN|nr:cytochrome P450 like protein [Calothrix parasitica NIES-267]